MTVNLRQFVLFLCIAASLLPEETTATIGKTYRLYDGITAFVDNPQGREFSISLDVRDINHRMHGPSELLVKVYGPDGRPVVREIIPDDGILTHTSNPSAAGWDHEAWYYATCYSRGLQPLVRWSAYSDPKRLKGIVKRTFTYKVKGGQNGVYRILLVGSPDHYVTLNIDPEMKYGVAGSPEWIHGHGQQFRDSFIYVPKTTKSINVLFLQFDEPAARQFTLKDSKGNVLTAGNGADGLVQTSVDASGKLDDQVLQLEVTEGKGDFLLNVTFQLENEFKPVRAKNQAITAVFSPDQATARATRGGTIYHDNHVFWQMHQVRMHDWLKKLKPNDFAYDKSLDDATGFISVGSHNSPKPDSADRIMHSFGKHKNPKALNAALRDMLFGMRLIGHGDHVAIGPKRNLAYEQGCYTFFWYRPAWRILQQTDAPKEVKEALREFIIQAGDRLAFCRTMATGNGNAFGSLMAGLKYCAEASQDPLQKDLFSSCFERFSNSGYGSRVGIGPSGGLQESKGYDLHYGSYVLRGWKAVIADLKDPKMIAARNRMLNLYSYIWSNGPGMPWSSRTSISKVAGGTYNAWQAKYNWKGWGGPDLLTGVNDHNEWFAARRRNYYAVTYHGRLTPTWEGEGFHGQIGLGGGGFCQLHVPSVGQVITAKPNSSYGSGMHLSEWPNFHVHSLVGRTADGLPLVTANSEHWNAKLEANVVSSSANVRQSSVSVSRRYTYKPSSIACEVRLGPTQHDNVFSIWGGRPKLRGKVLEAYEMIPFADVAKPKGKPRSNKNRTRIDVLSEDGTVAGTLDDQAAATAHGLGLRTDEATSLTGAGVMIACNGNFGALIEFDEPRKVFRGLNDTILVELTRGLTAASDVAFTYHVIPYSGKQPELGSTGSDSLNTLVLSTIEAVKSTDDLLEQLKEVAPLEVQDNQQTVGTLRLGISGEYLALVADIQDGKVQHHATPWKGSCLEVFGNMPDQTTIGQVFLAPQSDNTSSAGYEAKGGRQVPSAEILTASMATDTGYQIRALIPIDKLRIATDAEFRLEFQVSSHDGKQRKYHTLFGSQQAYENSQRYGTFTLQTHDDGHKDDLPKDDDK